MVLRKVSEELAQRSSELSGWCEGTCQQEDEERNVVPGSQALYTRSSLTAEFHQIWKSIWKPVLPETFSTVQAVSAVDEDN